MVNALAEGLNDNQHPHLPKYLLIIPDKDLITAADIYDYGVTKTLEDILKWLLVNIASAIDKRKMISTKSDQELCCRHLNQDSCGFRW